MVSYEDDTSRLPFFYFAETCEMSRPNMTCLPIDNDTPVYRLWDNPHAVSLNGYASPILVILIIVTNTFVCIVLLQRNLRTPTNLLLVGMAVSNTLTGIFPLPSYIYFYALGNYRDFVPHEWCYLNITLSLNLPTVFHTASIWLTVALAAHRYIYVCHPDKAKVFVTTSNTLKVMVGIYVAAFASQLIRFIEHQYFAVAVESRLHLGLFSGCIRELEPETLGPHQNLFFAVYWWFRVFFIHLIPCVSLVVLNSLLYHAMRIAQARRHMLLRQNRKIESRRLAEKNLATLMLLTVVGVFLLVEMPLAILLIATNVENMSNLELMEDNEKQLAAMVINFVILLSYPVNFFIYCGMSRQFRDSFKKLFGCWCARKTPNTELINL